jgi:hypothetical protein
MKNAVYVIAVLIGLALNGCSPKQTNRSNAYVVDELYAHPLRNIDTVTVIWRYVICDTVKRIDVYLQAFEGWFYYKKIPICCLKNVSGKATCTYAVPVSLKKQYRVIIVIGGKEEVQGSTNFPVYEKNFSLSPDGTAYYPTNVVTL